MEEKKLTGYPSIDKPWLKYYSEEAINIPMPKGTVFDYLWDNNKNHISDVALLYFDRKVTYAELFDNIERTAKAFQTIGVQSGDIVTMCAVSTPETIYAFYALSRLGAIANLIDLRADEHEIKRCLTEANSKLVLCLDLVTDKVMKAAEGTNVENMIVLSAADSLNLPRKLAYKWFQAPKIKQSNCSMSWHSFIVNGKSAQIVNCTTSAYDAVLMTHTSGTTGQAKGVMLSNSNINAVAFQYSLGMAHQRQQKYLAVIPPFIAFGICVAIHLPLSLGMTCIPIIKFDPHQFFDYLKKYRPNHFTCTPSNLEILIQDKRNLDLSFLCVPSVGGDYIGKKVEDKINDYLKANGCTVELVKGYGMTEVSSSACTTKNGYNRYGSVGFPLVNMTISVFKIGTNEELPYRQEGEICFTGPNVMLGYYKNQAETDKILKMHDDGTWWIHSGDIGYMDEDGFLFVIDRLKRAIHLSNGVLLLPSRVERKLTELPGISACAVVGKANADNKTVAKAYVVTSSPDMTEKTLLKYCMNNIPTEYCLEYIEIIDQLPLTPVGKVDYRALEREAQKEMES